MEKLIRVTCDPEKRLLRIPPAELNRIQGDLAVMPKEDYERLKGLIVEHGVVFALHVWREMTHEVDSCGFKWWVIDGHGRLDVVTCMIDQEGYVLDGPGLPCVEIEAASFAEAKLQVLASRSQFNKTTTDGLFEFMTDLGLKLEDMEKFDLPGIDLPAFKMEFFDEAKAEEGKDEKQKVEFEAYQNAAIKQVVLYFSAEDYTKILNQLDSLMTRWSLEDYSQVVWRLSNDRIQTES